MRWLEFSAIAFLVFAFGVITGAKLNQVYGGGEAESIVTQTDTVTTIDTLRIVETRHTVERQLRIDTLFVHQADTTVVHDSVFVEIPITQRVYADTTYTAWVSGFRPCLDSIEVYPRTRYITTTIETTQWKTKRWGLGISAGASYTPKGVQPYIGVGVQYNILQW